MLITISKSPKWIIQIASYVQSYMAKEAAITYIWETVNSRH